MSNEISVEQAAEDAEHLLASERENDRFDGQMETFVRNLTADLYGFPRWQLRYGVAGIVYAVRMVAFLGSFMGGMFGTVEGLERYTSLNVTGDDPSVWVVIGSIAAGAVVGFLLCVAVSRVTKMSRFLDAKDTAEDCMKMVDRGFTPDMMWKALELCEGKTGKFTRICNNLLDQAHHVDEKRGQCCPHVCRNRSRFTFRW